MMQLDTIHAATVLARAQRYPVEHYGRIAITDRDGFNSDRAPAAPLACRAPQSPNKCTIALSDARDLVTRIITTARQRPIFQQIKAHKITHAIHQRLG
jgi:hypothetical protein